MAFEYFLYNTNFNNTLIDRGANSFAPLPPNTEEIFFNFLIPNTQPLYYFRESGGTIILNDEATINAYLDNTIPSSPDDPITQTDFTGYTATTLNNINNRLLISNFNTYSGSTLTNINSKIPKIISPTTGNLVIVNGDGTLTDAGVNISSITGGTGFYFYTNRTTTQTNGTGTFATYLTITTPSLTAGTWSIDFNVAAGGQNSNKGIQIEFVIDGVVQGSRLIFTTNSSSNIIPFSLTKDLTLTAGSHIVLIRFSNFAGGTSFVNYGAIRGRIVK